MEIFNNCLYIGTLNLDPFSIMLTKKCFQNWNFLTEIPKGHGEIWRFDGKYWEQINIGGFGDDYNLGIREMKVYNNAIIAATMNFNTGCEIWIYN